MKRNCDVDGCGKTHYGRGYCAAHYRKFRLYGDPTASAWPAKEECLVDDCDKTSTKRGYCNAHYIRLRRHGDVSLVRTHKRPEDGKCTVDGCERDWLSRGFCKLHYDRMARASRECRVVGCGNSAEGGGLCADHAQAAENHVYEHPRKSAPEDGLCEVNGCSGEWVSAGYCITHYQLNVSKRREAQRLADYQVECDGCRSLFSPSAASPKFCSEECRPPGFRRTATGRLWVIRLAEENGWECRLCGTPVDSLLEWPNVMSGSVDHIVPVSTGGDDSPENLQLAHLWCNIRKGNRA